MSRRAREYAEAHAAKHPEYWEQDWRDERDNDDNEVPERDEPPPSNTFH